MYKKPTDIRKEEKGDASTYCRERKRKKQKRKRFHIMGRRKKYVFEKVL